MVQNITQNVKYQIETPSGWANFSGVKRETKKGILTLITSSGITLDCTFNHKIKTLYGFIEANDLVLGEKIAIRNNYEEVIHISKDPNRECYVYDALDVDKQNEYYTNGIVSHNCEFQGSSGTLISGTKLKTLVEQQPLHDSEGLKIYENLRNDKRIYCIIADVSRGKGLDYSAAHVIDITEMPYRQVATFRDNYTTPVEYAEILYSLGMRYNQALILVEINDIGGQVSDLLHFDYEYENILTTKSAGRSGKQISTGSGKTTDRGIRTTKSVKAIGCSMLKLLVEQDQIIIKDKNTIDEIKTFSKKSGSYEAESGHNDDLVMGLVLFSWLTAQSYFKELTDINTISQLRDRNKQEIIDEVLPFGFINDGGNEPEEETIHVDRGDGAWLMANW